MNYKSELFFRRTRSFFVKLFHTQDHIHYLSNILEQRRCVATWLVFLSSGEKISRPGIKPPTTPSGSGTSPLSFGSLGSSQTKDHIHYWDLQIL